MANTDIEKVVEGTATEIANAKVKVYGKAQNRTVLGIAHAYMIMYPHATLDDLRKAFPNSLNPTAGTEELFTYATTPTPKGELGVISINRMNCSLQVTERRFRWLVCGPSIHSRGLCLTPSNMVS